MFKVFDNILFKLIPSFISTRRKFRNLLSKVFKRYFKITGYFDLYSIPFNQLKFFDYSEKKDLFKPNAFSTCKNIADVLEENNIPYFITNWRKSEIENFAELFEEIKSGQKKFVFGYFAGLDGVQHMHTKDSDETHKKIQFYSGKFDQLFEILEKEYDEYEVAVFSDHGMTTLTSEVDIQAKISELNEEFGVDYLSFLDSTMARFWYFSEDARKNIREKLSSINEIELLSKEKLEEWGVYYLTINMVKIFILLNQECKLFQVIWGQKAFLGCMAILPMTLIVMLCGCQIMNPKITPKKLKIFSLVCWIK